MAKLTEDGFTNFVAKLGIGPQNLQSYATHSLAPFISRDRLSLEAAYRSSWLVGQVVDTVAEDMTREGVNISTKISPDDIKKLQASMTHLKILPALADTIRWARLYGGAIAVILTEGADYSKPLNPEAISKGRFKGLLVLDRWMMDPSFGELVTEVGIHMGTPKYYRVLAGMPALAGQQIHYTRIVRFDGIILPFHQKMAENLWGLSVVERMFDRLIAFDSATAGASQLLHKAHLRTISVDGFRDALALGGKTEGAIIKQFNYIRLLQTMEGLTVLDGKDNFQTHTYTFSGISDLLIQFGQQISGATGIPLVRLFGQSPAGLSSTGESDLRNYYDHINKLQENQMRIPMQKILDILCRSELGRPLPDDLEFDFAPLWQLSDLEKSQVVSSDVSSISAAYSAGIITKKIAMKELTENSRTTGRFTNISDEDIENAKEDAPMMGGEENPFGQPPQSEDTGKTLEELKQALESLEDVDDDNSLEELKAKLESLNMKEPVDKMPVKDKAFSKDGFFSKILKPLVALGIVLKLFSDNKTKLTAKERVDRMMGHDSDEQWIGIDLDGTLAKYYKWEGIENIGDPIPNMIQHVKKLIDKGERVKIFTARIAEDPEAAKYIQAWLVENGLPILEVVNEKDSMMKLLIDDRAIQVEKNTGKILSKKETLDAIKKEFQSLRKTVDKQIHAPKGGVTIKGKKFKGGEFIPNEGGYASIYKKSKKEQEKQKEDIKEKSNGKKDEKTKSSSTISRRGHVEISAGPAKRQKLAIEDIMKVMSVNKERAIQVYDSLQEYSDGYFTDYRKDPNSVGAQNIEDFIDKSPKWDKDKPLYRGIVADSKFVKGLKTGTTIDMKGMSSWSSSGSVAEKFASQSYEGTPVIFVLKSTDRATSISHISNAPHEQEVLLSRHSKLVVESIKAGPGGAVAYLKEIGSVKDRSYDTLIAKKDLLLKKRGKVLSLFEKWKLDSSIIEIAENKTTVDEQLRAPKGGVSIKGKEYEGGEFIPGSVNQEEAKKAIEKKKKENEGSIKAKETTGVTKGFLETKRDKDGRLTTTKGKPLPAHISKFPIPPAWTDVIYNPNPKGSLLVFARDSKGRPQTRYSDEHWDTTDKAKFARVYELGKKIKQIDNQLKADIAKGKDEAIIAKLIKETAIRPGSDKDTKAEVRAYGAVTLEARHIKNKDGKVILDFIGKKGVQAVIPVNDEDIAKLILKKAKNKKPNQKVFDTNYGRVLKYADTLDGGGFLLKDFRTLEANVLANKMIKSITMPTNKKECNAAMKQVAVAVAEKLNNTPSVVLKKYINPVVFVEWKLKAGVA